MKLFLDAEWNSFGGELISMALVSEIGIYWYKVLECKNPDPWVAENVIPSLVIEPISKEEMQKSLEIFLCQYDSIHIIADWPEDIQYFCQLLITGPGTRINTPPLTMEIRRDINSDKSIIPHNALEDAFAIKKMYCGLMA